MKSDGRVDDGGGQTTVEEFANVPHETTADRIERHVGEGDDVRLVVCYNGHTSTDDTVELL